MNRAGFAAFEWSVLVALSSLLACSRSDLDWPLVAPGQGVSGSVGSVGAGAVTGAGGNGTGGGSGAAGTGPGATGGSAGSVPALPELIPAESPSDAVHDASRRLLYISMPDGRILRYDLERFEFRDPIMVGGVLLGIDLSFDHKTLAVADEGFVTANAATLARNWIHLVDLETGQITKLEFSDEIYEAGTYMPLFLDNSTLLVSSSYPGTGDVWLRRVNLIDGSYEKFAKFRQDTALIRSGDASVVAYAESSVSNGPFGYYEVAGGRMAEAETGWFVHTIGVSRDAAQFAVPTYAGMFVYDRELRQLTTMGTYAEQYPASVVYSPTSNVMYLIWNDRKRPLPIVESYDTDTFTRRAIIDANNRYGSNTFAPGRMRISKDGRLLFVLGYEGVTAYAVDP